jgi:hypothetical protein
MGNQTEATTVILGGALATLLAWFFGPTFEAMGRAMTPGIEAAFATLVIAGLAILLPGDLLSKIRRRTRPRRDEAPR